MLMAMTRGSIFPRCALPFRLAKLPAPVFDEWVKRTGKPILDAPYVRECAVIGAADKARGRIVKAYVVLAEQAIPAELTVRD